MKIFISLEITYFRVKATITKALEGKLQASSAEWNTRWLYNLGIRNA